MTRKIVRLKFDDWTSASIVGRSECRINLGILLELRIDGSRTENILRHYSSDANCPFCGEELRYENQHASTGLTNVRSRYEVCVACGSWQHIHQDSFFGEIITVPIVRQFDRSTETPSLLHLAKEIRNNREQVYSMEPYKFERFVGSVLAEHHRCEVRHVGQSGDDGVDLVAVISDAPLLIQVKRRQNPDATEGIEVVKLLFASAFGQGVDAGMVVTTAGQFSKPAIRWSGNQRLKDHKFRLELVAILDLMHMIDAVADEASDPPWLIHDQSTASRSATNWSLTAISGGCVLRNEGIAAGTFLVIDYAYLERYWVFEGITSSVPDLDAALTVDDVIDRLRPLCSNSRLISQSYDFEEQWGIPEETMDELNGTLLELFPEDVKRRFPFGE